ncbi:hypothetical protein HDV00_012510 [Rhizophlyctis rosea]|nr:hypothetical protein HDV00_012510 [Rhizophlyctis rosea]
MQQKEVKSIMEEGKGRIDSHVAIRARRQREGRGEIVWEGLTGTSAPVSSGASSILRTTTTTVVRTTTTTTVGSLSNKTTIEKLSQGKSGGDGEGRKRGLDGGRDGEERRKRVSGDGGKSGGSGDGGRNEVVGQKGGREVKVEEKDQKGRGTREYVARVKSFISTKSYTRFQQLLRAFKDRQMTIEQITEEVVGMFVDAARVVEVGSGSEGDGGGGEGERMKIAMELLGKFSTYVPSRKREVFLRRVEGVEMELRDSGELVE